MPSENRWKQYPPTPLAAVRPSLGRGVFWEHCSALFFMLLARFHPALSSTAREWTGSLLLASLCLEKGTVYERSSELLWLAGQLSVQLHGLCSLCCAVITLRFSLSWTWFTLIHLKLFRGVWISFQFMWCVVIEWDHVVCGQWIRSCGVWSVKEIM